jgi:hypothetical protein
VTGALEWIEGPVWTAEIEDTCCYPDDDEPGAFLVSIRSDEDSLRIDVEHSTRGNRLDSDWIEGADLAQAKARAETMWRALSSGGELTMLRTGASTMPTLKEMRDDRPTGKRRSRLPRCASTGAGQMSECAEDRGAYEAGAGTLTASSSPASFTRRGAFQCVYSYRNGWTTHD